MLEGWRESRGVQAEIDVAIELDLPIWYIEPTTGDRVRQEPNKPEVMTLFNGKRPAGASCWITRVQQTRLIRDWEGERPGRNAVVMILVSVP